MASLTRRSGGEVYNLGVGVQVLDYRRFLVALLLVMSCTVAGVHCITTDALAPGAAPPPSDPKQQNFTSFSQDEVDALNAIYRNWTELNPSLTAILNWTSTNRHPCNNSKKSYYNKISYQGAWGGVFCTSIRQKWNATSNYYVVSVTSLRLYGNNMSCYGAFYSQRCDFEGITGVLPSEISGLINLESLVISHNPNLTGPVPLEIWELPSLKNIDLSFNQLHGPVDFEGLNTSTKMNTLDLRNNNFNGTFSTGSYFNPVNMILSNNAFTSIKFANYTGKVVSRKPGTAYILPSLYRLDVGNNKLSGPFPAEILQILPSLQSLDLSRNDFFGPVDFRGVYFKGLYTLNISWNNFNGTFFFGSNFNPQTIDLSNNYFNNIIFNETDNIANDYMPLLNYLYMQNNKLSGNFPAPISKIPKLKILNIENNNFSGTFPEEILKAPRLQTLYAGQNQYNALFLPDMAFENFSLSRIFLTKNNFGIVEFAKNQGPFTGHNLQFSNYLFLGGNPYCNKLETLLLSTICRMNQSDTLSVVDAKKSSTKNTIIIATSTSLSFAFVLMIIALYVWRLMSRIQSFGIILREFEKRDVKPNLYSYKEIKLATKNFDKKNMLGEGGFGVVYKGELLDGTIVAVKKLTMSSNQVLSEFLNEVVVISGLKHRNLVKLKGCCLGDGDQRILIFEYVENKNLAEALSLSGDVIDNYEPPDLDWTRRFNIIVGIARGLAYLHEDLQSPIIHRDIKAANILLDKDYNPKIVDFGLAYLFPTMENEATHLTLVQVAGTRGYCSPEYALHGHVSTALDVYSFGIVILEIMSGRKSIDFQKLGEEIYLREWAWKQFEAQTFTTLIDSKMKHSSSNLEAITRVISVALACLQYKVAKRPKMHDVVPMLLGNMPISNFCKGFEHGDALDDVASSFSVASDTTLSLCGHENPPLDEHHLLSNTYEIEMKTRA